MTGVPLKQLLRMREEYADEFDRFKIALTSALTDELARSDPSQGLVWSAKTRDEYIQPALSDIDRRLRGSRRAMSVKVAQNAVIGGIMTGAGFAASLPLVISAGVACAEASVAHLNKMGAPVELGVKVIAAGR